MNRKIIELVFFALVGAAALYADDKRGLLVGDADDLILTGIILGQAISALANYLEGAGK